MHLNEDFIRKRLKIPQESAIRRVHVVPLTSEYIFMRQKKKWRKQRKMHFYRVESAIELQ